MEIKNNSSVFDGGAQIDVSISIDTDALVKTAILDEFDKKLDEINGEVI